MKKLFLLGVLSLMIYSCQKTTIEPQAIVLPQQSQCGPLGDCYSGTYLFDSIKTMDPTINATGTDTIVNGLTVQVLYNGDTIINTRTYIKYKLDSVTCNLPFIDPNIISNFNHLYWLKGTTYGPAVSLVTKSNKVMIFWKL